jgi:hypothetical protein
MLEKYLSKAERESHAVVVICSGLRLKSVAVLEVLLLALNFPESISDVRE